MKMVKFTVKVLWSENKSEKKVIKTKGINKNECNSNNP